MVIYLETFSSCEEYKKSSTLKLSMESLLTYCVYIYCTPKNFSTFFVFCDRENSEFSIDLHIKDVHFVEKEDIPWQVTLCRLPVALYEDTIITGLCAVARHICKHRSTLKSSFEHKEGILGYCNGCLQAPNEVSIWTKFCEVDIIKTVTCLLKSCELKEIPINMVRFENHLKKPVRIHNIYKVARELNKENVNKPKEEKAIENDKESVNKTRVAKPRKWKSNTKKNIETDSLTKLSELGITHQFAEGPFVTLADILLLPSYHILIQKLEVNVVKESLPLTYSWYTKVINIPEIKLIKALIAPLKLQAISLEKLLLPEIEDVSLYKSDPKRHNPKKRLFTKPEDIEKALSCLTEDMEFKAKLHDFDEGINWDEIPEGVNPAGYLPEARVHRKSQQLENKALAITSMAKDGDLIIDFCSGSGHLGILIAHLLPKCTVILLENKEQSLLRAKERVHLKKLSNVYFCQGNLDFFIGKFDVGVALHACGIASDLVLDKCLQANAKFLLCPCCYGSLHATDRIVYPRSKMFKCLSLAEYLCIGHTADQTHKKHPLSARGVRCMTVIDSDRSRYAEEHGYTVTLLRLKPLSCTPKNNLLIGVPKKIKSCLSIN